MTRPNVFAVEDTSIQVCWDTTPPGPAVVVCTWRDGSVTVPFDAPAGPDAAAGPAGPDAPAGPRAVVVDSLPHSTNMDVSVGGRHVETVTTLTPPPGRRLSRFATINDIHVGASGFGTYRMIWNDDPGDPAPVRCARAAITEAVAWGADALVVKGDMTDQGRPQELEIVGELLAGSGLPVLAIEGNHEGKALSVDGRAILARHGITLTVDGASHIDLPGARIIAAPTARWHHHGGHITERTRSEALALLAAVPRDAGGVVALHHYPQRFRHSTIYPSGIPGPEAAGFLDAVAAAHPATIVLSGHSHRHRRHHHGPLTVAEVGSTKDFPGSWAGYTVYEGGILQTTRRVMAPAAIAWTAKGRRVLGGVWGIWAPGVRSHRCFTYVWPS